MLQRATKAGVADSSWGPYLTQLMKMESGGNPMAENKNPVLNTWSNPGHPFYEKATGLFQMLPSTFAKAARDAGIQNPDIHNPEDNLLAAIYYIKGRYGTPARIFDRNNMTTHNPDGSYKGY